MWLSPARAIPLEGFVVRVGVVLNPPRDLIRMFLCVAESDFDICDGEGW